MNSDEIMSEPTGPSSQPHQRQRRQHTSRAPKNPASGWQTMQWLHDVGISRSRLKHQRFSVAEYPDPLAPFPPHPLQYPKGTDPDLERRLHQLITETKAGCGSGGATVGG